MKARTVVATHVIWTDRLPTELVIEGSPILALPYAVGQPMAPRQPERGRFG